MKPNDIETLETPAEAESLAGIATTGLFSDLIAAHGEESGGVEDFYVVDDQTIDCRYGDCSIRLKSDGWHYGSNTPAHPTPLAAFENRAGDYHISENDQSWPMNTEPMTPDSTENSVEVGIDVQRLVRRFNYHVREDEGGWHQHICCDVEYSNGKVIRSRKQATLYTYDYEHKDECVDDASDLAAYFNANAKAESHQTAAQRKRDRKKARRNEN